MKRVLALGAALLLVAIAVLVRQQLDDGGSGSGGGDGGDGGALVVACVPELADVCSAIAGADVRVEAPADTIAALEGDDPPDAWVTFDPWPELAEVDAQRALFDEPARPVASSPLLLLTRSNSVPAGCEDPNWDCIVDGRANGGPSLPAPSTAFGAVAIGHAALEWSAVARPGEPFARQELALPNFRAWLAGIDLGARDPLDDMFVFANAGPVATAVTDVTYRDRVVGSRDEAALEPHTGALEGTIAVVVAGRSADRVAGDDRFNAALLEQGWLRGEARAAGLPNAGVLFAIVEETS